MTNGIPDSILEMGDDDQDAIRDERYAAMHPDCELCTLTVCLDQPNCDCAGDTAGVEAVETNSQTGHTFKVHVHAFVCAPEWEKHEKAARALAETSKARLERLVEQVKGQLALKPAAGAPPWDQWCEERARNIVAGLIAELK
jgi:hypothetical protein